MRTGRPRYRSTTLASLGVLVREPALLVWPALAMVLCVAWFLVIGAGTFVVYGLIEHWWPGIFDAIEAHGFRAARLGLIPVALILMSFIMSASRGTVALSRCVLAELVGADATLGLGRWTARQQTGNLLRYAAAAGLATTLRRPAIGYFALRKVVDESIGGEPLGTADIPGRNDLEMLRRMVEHFDAHGLPVAKHGRNSPTSIGGLIVSLGGALMVVAFATTGAGIVVTSVFSFFGCVVLLSAVATVSLISATAKQVRVLTGRCPKAFRGTRVDVTTPSDQGHSRLDFETLTMLASPREADRLRAQLIVHDALCPSTPEQVLGRERRRDLTRSIDELLAELARLSGPAEAARIARLLASGRLSPDLLDDLVYYARAAARDAAA